jgi:hypothetical protein
MCGEKRQIEALQRTRQILLSKIRRDPEHLLWINKEILQITDASPTSFGAFFAPLKSNFVRQTYAVYAIAIS